MSSGGHLAASGKGGLGPESSRRAVGRWAALVLVVPLPTAVSARAAGEQGPRAPFVENRGQWAADASFAAGGVGWRAAVEPRGWRLALSGADGRSTVVRFRVPGDAPTVATGERPDGVARNFFQGRRRGVGARAFERVRIAGLAPGIELALREADGVLEYDLELAAGADPTSFEFEVEGASLGEIAADGSLVLRTPLGELLQAPPRTFELAPDGSRLELRTRCVRRGERRFAFELEGGPRDRPIVIDPALIWSTYIGGNTAQSVRTIVPSGDGALIAGSTESLDFPITPGVFDPTANGGVDAFVSALDGQGRLLWSTFLGGVDTDLATGFARDGAGVVTVAGTTRSLDLPATPGAFDTSFGGGSDGFVARLSADGTQLLWCTYLGGLRNDELHALAVDSQGRASVAGWSTSFDAPTTPGVVGPAHAPGLTADGYVAQLQAGGAGLVFATYLGGGAVDELRALALAGDAVIVGGTTQSADFPFTNGSLVGTSEGLVARLEFGATQLTFATAVGGGGDDEVRGAAFVAGHVLAAGRTTSQDLPATAGTLGPTPGGLADGFLARVDASGNLVAAAYLGGTAGDEVLALAGGKQGEIFVAGWTESPDFPTTPGAFDRGMNIPAQSFGGDCFVARAGADLAALDYATFLGAAGDERAFAVAPVDADTVLLAGETDSFFFPTTPGAHRTSRGVNATVEGFATRLDLVRHPVPYGVGKTTSTGSSPVLRWTGFPSVADHNFVFVVDSAVPNQPVVMLLSKGAASQPFFGGTLYLAPPVKRIGTDVLDFVGYAEFPFTFPAWSIGSTLYAQAWFKDPWDPQLCGLTSALEVLVHP